MRLQCRYSNLINITTAAISTDRRYQHFREVDQTDVDTNTGYRYHFIHQTGTGTIYNIVRLPTTGTMGVTGTLFKVQ
jgi:hypothetical protein